MTYRSVAAAIVTFLAALMMACSAVRPPSMLHGVDSRVIPAKISLTVQQEGAGQLIFRGGVALQSSDPEFGRYSGLHLSNDRQDLVAVGWGSWLTGRLAHNDAGDLSGFALEDIHALTDVLGNEVDDKSDQDAESLFQDGGHYYVGFETNNRI